MPKTPAICTKPLCKLEKHDLPALYPWVDEFETDSASFKLTRFLPGIGPGGLIERGTQCISALTSSSTRGATFVCKI